MMSQDDKNTSVFLDGDLSHAESRKGGEFFSRKERIDRKGWKHVKLGDVCDLKNGYAFASESYVSRGKYFVITIANVQDGRFVIGDETNKINSMPIDVQKHQILKKGNLLISMTGNVGRVCVVDRNDCLLNQRVGLLEVNNTVDKTFIYYRLQHFDFQQKMISAGKGGAQPNIGKHDILGFEFDLPEIPEQKAISKSLSCINHLIFSLQNLAFKYEAIKKATVNLLLKPKEGWRRIRLDDCCMCLDNMRKPVNEEMRQSMKGDIPYCGANGIVDYVNDYTINDSVILIAEDGGYFDEYQTRSIAYMIIGKAWVNNHAHILKAKNGYCQDYIFHTLEHKNIVPFITSGTRAKLTKRELLNIEINAPESVYEQRKIATQISAIDNALNDCRAQLAKAQSLKQGMMSYFFG